MNLSDEQIRPRTSSLWEQDCPPNAMILAAGRGERMRPLTDRIPKPLLPVAGKPLIEHHLVALATAGIVRVVVNLAWQGDKIRAALAGAAQSGVRIVFTEEGEQALETGGGIFNALPELGPQPFIVVNADVWTDFPFRSLEYDGASLAHLVLVPNPEHNSSGDFGLEDGRVSDGEPRYTFSGIGVYRQELFRGCQPGIFSLVPMLREAITAGRVTGQLYRGRWLDIGTPERLREANAALGYDLDVGDL